MDNATKKAKEIASIYSRLTVEREKLGTLKSENVVLHAYIPGSGNKSFDFEVSMKDTFKWVIGRAIRYQEDKILALEKRINEL